MEQPTQQPIQEATEIKPPVKTGWKFIAIVLVFALLAIGGILLLQSFDQSETKLPRQRKMSVVSVVPEHRSCVTDSDCIIVDTNCSGCECGASVNKQYAQYYRDKYTNLCSDYHGGFCEFYCQTPFAKCLNSQCVLSAEQPQETIDTSTDSTSLTAGWQTYRNDEFGFEVKYPDQFVWEALEEVLSKSRIQIVYEENDGTDIGVLIVSVKATDKTNVRELSPLLNSEYTKLGPYEVLRLLPDSPPFSWRTYFLIHNGKEYALNIQGKIRELDQILSTFKFIDENTISWEEAVDFIRNCQVEMVAQTHSRSVSITLKDGTSKSTVEPEIDMVIEEAQSASTKCGFDIGVLTE